jgi:C-terminal processing protease CtpA/Prc
MLWFLIVSTATAQLFEIPRTCTLLASTRQDIQFVPYTPAQRQEIADSMKRMFEIYVNRENKIEYYGQEKPDIDPLPKVTQLQQKAQNMTDKDFHYEFIDMFSSLRDFHTQYYLPAPHSCFSALQPLLFTQIGISSSRGTRLVVKGFSPIPEVMNLSNNIERRVQVGDEVISINGYNFTQYIQMEKYLIGGANDYGAIRNGILYMTFRDGQTRKMPTENHVHYLLRSRTTRRLYGVLVPWIAARDDQCYENALKVIENERKGIMKNTTESSNVKIMAKALKTVQKPFSQTELRRIRENLEKMEHDELSKFKGFFPQPPIRPSLRLQDTADPGVKWTVWKRESKNLGIISLSSFSPVSRNPLKITEMIRSLLLNQLARTNAVLIDVRDNPGGLIILADSLPQLFGSNIEGVNGRAVVDEINSSIFFSSIFSSNDPWVTAYRQATMEDAYSPLVPFTGEQERNSFGQAYIKPLGIYTNARCYSSCDLFAANIRDNNVGFVFGEDLNTGGGGANVVCSL